MSSSSPHAAAVTRWRQLPLSLSPSLCTRAIQPLYKYVTTTITFCALSHIYTYMTFRHIYICVLPIGRNRSEPVLRSAGHVSQQTPPSLRHGMSLQSDLLPTRSQLVGCQHLGQCLTRSRPCESLSARTLILLLAPGSSDTYAGYASSWNGRPRSSQGGWHFLTVAIESVFLLPDTELPDEVLHP